MTRHKARIGGQPITYTVTAGTLLMKNDEDEPIALFGFTAYVLGDYARWASSPTTTPMPPRSHRPSWPPSTTITAGNWA